VRCEKASTRIEVIIDKSKSKKEIREFNEYIIRHPKGRIDPLARVSRVNVYSAYA